MSQVNAMVQDVETISDAVERAHSILGLAVFAEPDQVKAAFRHRAFVCHPDAGGNAEAFNEIQAAADYLCRPGVREWWILETNRTATSKNSATPTASPRHSCVTPPSTRSKSKLQSTPRYPALLAAALFGCVLAPHFKELGLTWDPVPFQDLCRVMQSLDWVFFAVWWWLKKPSGVQKARRTSGAVQRRQ
jgi:hypothetical protein